MKHLLLFGLLVLISITGFAQNPHGKKFSIDCKECHTVGDWSFKSIENGFSHDSDTDFLLKGSHSTVTCTDCHQTLDFKVENPACISCHQDVHLNSVGSDCARCHNETAWQTLDIQNIHEQNGFPLVGQHQAISCENCHVSDNNLRWDRIGNDCISCHQTDFLETENPNHGEAGFSTNCI